MAKLTHHVTGSSVYPLFLYTSQWAWRTLWYIALLCCKFMSFLFVYFTGSPNCPTINTTVDSTSLTVSIQKTQMTRLPEWYSVQVLPCNESTGIVVYNSTLKDPALVHVASLEPDTVYNISVIPCNMAGCNESCDIHSVQTESDTAGTTGEMDRMHNTYIAIVTNRLRCVQIMMI